MNPELITLIINIILGVFVLIGFLSGLRGIKKSTFSLVMFVIQLVVIFFISPVVSKALLNISISGITINQHISNAIYDLIGADLASTQFIKNLVDSIPAMVINLVTTILLLLITTLIFKIIGAILYRIIFGKDSKKVVETCEIVNGTPQMVTKTEKKKKHRLWGGLVGSVHGFLFALAMLLPACGLVNVAGDVVGVNSASAEVESSSDIKHFKDIMQENIPTDVLDYIQAIDNSIVAKIGSVGNISEASFNLVAKTSINGTSVSFGEEIKSLISTYDSFVDFVNSSSSTLGNGDIESIFNDLKNNPENYDFNKLYKIVDKLFESNLVKAIGNDALKFIGDMLVDGAEDEDTLRVMTRVKVALYNYVDSGANLKDDIKALIGVVEDVLKSDLIDAIEQEPFKIDNVANVLLNEEDLVNNKPKNELLNKILNKATSSVLLQKFVLEFINYGILELETVMENNLEFSSGYDVNLTRINSEQNITIKTTELEAIISDGYNLYKKIEALDTEAIEKDIYEIFAEDLDIESIINISGNILDKVVSMSVFKDTGVFYGICDALNESQYKSYIDFELLKNENEISTQLGYLANAVGEFRGSGIIADLREITEQNMGDKLKVVISKLAQEVENGTKLSKIVSPLLKCTVLKPSVEYGLEAARDYIEKALKDKNESVVINKFNTQNLMTEQENEKLIGVLNNVVQFISNIDIDKMLTNEFIDELINNNGAFGNLGRAMDSIKSSSIFADYKENGQTKEGVYKCILNALNGMETFNEYFDFSVAKQEDFVWEDTTDKLETLTANLENITVDEKSLIKYIFTNSDYSSLVDKLRTWLTEEVDGEQREIKLTELFELNILKPTSVKLVNLINSTIKDFVNNEDVAEEEQLGKYIVDIDLTANIYDQATSINNIINKALVIDFENLDVDNINKETDLPKIKALLKEMEGNANLVDANGNYYGVFRESYKAIALKLVNVINDEIATFVGEDLKLGILYYNADSVVSVNLDNLMNIIEKSIDFTLSADLTIKTLDKTKLKNLLDSIQTDAINLNGPFAVSYNAIMLKMVNLINENVLSIVGDAGSKIALIETPINVAFDVSTIRSILDNTIDCASKFDNIDIKTLNVEELFDFIDLFKNNSTLAGNAFAETDNALLVHIINTVNKEVANKVGTEFAGNIKNDYNGDATPDYTATKNLLTITANALNSLEDEEGFENLEETVLNSLLDALGADGIKDYTQNTKTAIVDYLASKVVE